MPDLVPYGTDAKLKRSEKYVVLVSHTRDYCLICKRKYAMYNLQDRYPIFHVVPLGSLNTYRTTSNDVAQLFD